jgi:SAM-dependent methyltransferase
MRSTRWRNLAPRLRRVLLPAQSALLLRTTAPIGKNWGWDRGTPVDRIYIESFLERHRRDISGRVLEIKDASYTRRFGSGVTRSDVLDVNRENSGATIYADLAAADEVPSDAFDCIILTQTLQLILDVPAALAHLHRVLASEGVVLATVPTLSRVAPGSDGTDYWRFTPAACAELFDATFGAHNVLVEPMGNVLAGVAFLHGLGAEELPRTKLEEQDVEFPLVVGVRAVKRA